MDISLRAQSGFSPKREAEISREAYGEVRRDLVSRLGSDEFPDLIPDSKNAGEELGLAERRRVLGSKQRE